MRNFNKRLFFIVIETLKKHYFTLLYLVQFTSKKRFEKDGNKSCLIHRIKYYADIKIKF